MMHASHSDLIQKLYCAESPEIWQAVLGPGMHYHFGFFQGDEDLETGQQQTVRNFFADIPFGTRVLDAGCGWGGPARMLMDELGCQVTGVTVSPVQAAYCRKRDIFVEIMDIEQKLPQGSYDVAFCLEAMEHVVNKAALLTGLRRRASRLALSTGCIADASQQRRWCFGDSIFFCTPAELESCVHMAGWSIRRMTNRRLQSLRTLALWKKNLDPMSGQFDKNGQIGILQRLVDEALADPLRWCSAHPLIDIIAD